MLQLKAGGRAEGGGLKKRLVPSVEAPGELGMETVPEEAPQR